MAPKEDAYDENIAPLMTQIIAMCKEHKIPVVASFGLDKDENGEHLLCTTALASDDYDPPAHFARCAAIMRQERTSPMMVTVRDGDGNVKESHAIL